MLNMSFEFGLNESLRWIKFAFIFIFFSSIAVNNEVHIQKAILVCFVLMVFINSLQLVNPYGIGSFIAKFYTHHRSYYEMSDGVDRTFRLIGTAVNPNNNGVLWLLMFIYFLHQFLFKIGKYNIILIGISFLFIILTQSRTTLVAALLSAVIFMFIKGVNLKTLLYFFCVLFLGFILVISLNFTYIMQLFLYNPLELHSLQLRFAVWREMWDFYLQKPFFGWGFIDGLDHFLNASPDNEHIYVLLLNGALGLMIFLWLLIYPIIIYFSKMDKFKHVMIIVLFGISFLILGLTNVTIINVRVGLIFFAYSGITYSFLAKRKLEIESKN